MSEVGLFVLGSFVTLLVVAAVALLVFAAILDGRDEADRRAPLAPVLRLGEATDVVDAA